MKSFDTGYAGYQLVTAIDRRRERMAMAWSAYNSRSGRPNRTHVRQILRSTSTDTLVRLLSERGIVITEEA